MANEHPGTSSQVIPYNLQLDGLRFFAVLFVVCYHWLPSISEIKLSYFFGGLVNFFFVLSSYLITLILFKARQRSDNMDVSKVNVMVTFLLRRTIRIFPAYYCFLAIVFLLPTIGAAVQESPVMYISYLVNYHIFEEHLWPPVTSHIWTLAVEEQFYLVWPLFIIFIPYRHLLKTLLSLIVGSILLRAIFYYPAEGVPQDILTQFCVDSFAIGGILAYKYTVSLRERKIIDKYFRIILFIAIPAGTLIIFSQSLYLSFVFNKFFFAVVSMAVIDGAITGYKNFFGKFLQNKVVGYLGRISYGIYLYHLLVPIVFWKLYSVAYGFLYNHFPHFFALHQHSIATFENILSSEAACFVIYSICVILLAMLSWYVIEVPFSKLKIYVDFNSRKIALKKLKETFS